MRNLLQVIILNLGPRPTRVNSGVIEVNPAIFAHAALGQPAAINGDRKGAISENLSIGRGVHGPQRRWEWLWANARWR